MDAVRPYPWQALERMGRSALVALAAVRDALAGWDRASVERELSAIIGENVRILSTSARSAAVAPLPTFARLGMGSPDGTTHMIVELDPALTARLVSALLKRPCPIPDPLLPVPDSVQGAAAAVALLLSRRLGTPLVLHAIGDGCRPGALPNAIRIDATVLVGDESFACRATIACEARPTGGAQRPEQVLRLGELELALPLVVAVVQPPRTLLKSLRAGDVLVPGEPWMIERSDAGLHGHAVLCAPSASRGLRVDLLDTGRIVLGEGTMSLDLEEPSNAATTADVLADAPVLVRIELGQLSMTARQWAALKPGDIIASGTRVADRAVLRIAGREVARGELVDIEGELGVRIHELIGQDNGGST